MAPGKLAAGQLMPNKPRPENRHRMVRVEDELWRKAGEVAAEQGTTRSAVIRDALRRYVREHQRDDQGDIK